MSIILDLDAIEARSAAATDGPWWTDGVGASRVYASGLDDWITVAGDLETPDAEFIAHARTDMPALVAEVWRLRGAIQQLADNQQSWIDAGRDEQMISRNAVRDTMQRVLAGGLVHGQAWRP
jgi:hypothetical protein